MYSPLTAAIRGDPTGVRNVTRNSGSVISARGAAAEREACDCADRSRRYYNASDNTVAIVLRHDEEVSHSYVARRYCSKAWLGLTATRRPPAPSTETDVGERNIVCHDEFESENPAVPLPDKVVRVPFAYERRIMLFPP